MISLWDNVECLLLLLVLLRLVMYTVCIKNLLSDWIRSYRCRASSLSSTINETCLAYTHWLLGWGQIKHVLISRTQLKLHHRLLSGDMGCTYITLPLLLTVAYSSIIILIAVTYVNVFLWVWWVLEISSGSIILELVIDNCRFLTWILSLSWLWHLLVKVSRVIL